MTFRFSNALAMFQQVMQRILNGMDNFCNSEGVTPNVEKLYAVELFPVPTIRLNELLTHPPLLAYPNFVRAFEVHTDASRDGLGAVVE
uniref:Reverse transcriptase/retrotransposon-derived protein RNase H-like domain-containing protein n=1 Tax=Amphimedon queenslandica TaxID=400682 RepID=A0A1X7UG75_AMPQE